MRIRRGRPPKLALEGAEAGLMETLAKQLIEVFDVEDSSGDVRDPLESLIGPVDNGEAATDPVMMRLLPDAYTDDDEAAIEWRRFGRSEVRSAKLDSCRLVLSDCGVEGPVTIELDDEHLSAWLGVLTDLRLALAIRLDITEDWVQDALRLEEGDPRRSAYEIYEWLSITQSHLVDVAG